ncbi:Lrp/AsnC family transcriptional regulator [Clostridium sp. Marseille-P2415]|uniref:Lrp/AsnC family transcriptional regulator n=1 Tax=Clostridium sp. Marseille-P2415 TaxID=1805471 RepID=UPI0009888163|nr:Lrp/AsnC family transcriptional regulator [Clostridium sp. Marseille-P2415]
MDDIDKKIVQTLQKNARASLKNIAENTFLSSPAVSSRIEKLEREKIITGYHASVDPMKLGYHIIAFVNLDVSPVDKIQFYAYMEAIPNVLECNCVTGDYSMLIKVAFQSTMELDIFIGQLQKYGKTSTQIVFSTPVGPRGVDVMAELGEKE